MSSFFFFKFVRILKIFSFEEWKFFEFWFKFFWVNSNKNLVCLVDKFKKYYFEFMDVKFIKEKLFK